VGNDFVLNKASIQTPSIRDERQPIIEVCRWQLQISYIFWPLLEATRCSDGGTQTEPNCQSNIQPTRTILHHLLLPLAKLTISLYCLGLASYGFVHVEAPRDDGCRRHGMTAALL